MFCDTLPLQLLSKNHIFLIFWNEVDLPPSLLDNVFKYTVFFLEITPYYLTDSVVYGHPPTWVDFVEIKHVIFVGSWFWYWFRVVAEKVQILPGRWNLFFFPSCSLFIRYLVILTIRRACARPCWLPIGLAETIFQGCEFLTPSGQTSCLAPYAALHSYAALTTLLC